MKHLGDITKINGAEIEVVDVITGGSPCQDLSIAGKRAGLAHGVCATSLTKMLMMMQRCLNFAPTAARRWTEVTTIRLIDADKFILALMDASLSSVDEDTILDLVDSVPTVDAVIVTRCKDCRSYNKPKTGWCEVHLDREHPDDFCSYGERRAKP